MKKYIGIFGLLLLVLTLVFKSCYYESDIISKEAVGQSANLTGAPSKNTLVIINKMDGPNLLLEQLLNFPANNRVPNPLAEIGSFTMLK